MSVPAKLGVYLAVLAVVFVAALGLGDALGGADGADRNGPAPSTTAPVGSHPGHDEDGS